jgi:hypothetical protein
MSYRDDEGTVCLPWALAGALAKTTKENELNTHTIIKQGTMQTAVAYIDGEMYTISESDPHFENVVAQLDEGVYKPELFDVYKAMEHSYTRLGERFAVLGRTILFDNDPIEGPAQEMLLKFLDAGEDTAPYVRYLEKLATNPDDHSREQGLVWMGRNDFQIAPDGDIWCYKGMYPKGDGYAPNYNGSVLINGERCGAAEKGQRNGDIVEMPRSETSSDPHSPCATGLHVANWNFASGYASHTVLVKVNPRDIVNVPYADAEKMRVCRYIVCGLVNEPITGLVLAAPDYVTEEPVYLDPYGDPSAPLSTEPITSDGALEDEDEVKPEGAAARLMTKITGRPSKRKVTRGTDWNEKNVKKLLACKTDKQLQKAFPGVKLDTLKRRRREFKNG